MSEESQIQPARASYSRLSYYKNCPLAYKFKYIDKIKPLEAPVQKDRHGNIKPPAWQRGSTIHQSMDDYINGKEKVMRPELLDLKFQIDSARQLKENEPNRVLTEQNKYFDDQYEIIDLDSLPEEEKTLTSGGDICPVDYHLLVIIDLLFFNEDFTHATVVDLKSGKIHPAKHMAQTQLYALMVAQEYPTVENITTQLWYCDQGGKVTEKEYTRDKISALFNFWNRSITTMQTDTEFKPRPHESNCMFCEYGKSSHSNRWVNKNDMCQDSMDKRFRI